MAITISHLGHSYRDFTLTDVDFTVEPGTVVGFLGPNGAGKSTTLRLLLGLETPRSGSTLIDGTPYTQLERPLSVVGSLIDTRWINGHQRAIDHLRWLAVSNGLDQSRIPGLLDRVGLSGAARRRVSALSLGMRQRLGIAAALLGEPRYLVFDEPLNGLDPAGIRWVRDLVRELREEGRGILLSSHFLGEVAEVADRIVLIGSGRIVAQGSLDEVRGEYSLEQAFFEHLATAG